ncbi:flavodoxin family protein [Salinibacterium soli]|uniref:NAD(P)H-dependent oxidoreductase n=1 Tax=Antiquaquibacter soli TaxID=3064523 RepID=A0ABT9BIF8_9MICO|nr:NAD(P)H-dependent oxidoreductase [Protaetiibacter sp. WY-16]MDO7880813.1 NAD(P)H-dependent oxidoreductase [Protaetiibacter sp. WY-16]
MQTGLTALALVCTLTPSPKPSSTQLLADQLLEELAAWGVQGDSIRTVDLDIRAGVTADEGDGDQWPGVRTRIIDADILVVAAPIWMGHLSSEGQRVLERLDAELGVYDDEGRAILAGKVAVTAIVGNEDGAHHATAELYQGLNDVGFTIPSQGGTYWVGEAMQSVDFRDLDEVPEAVASTTALVAANAAHLASVLREHPYKPSRA